GATALIIVVVVYWETFDQLFSKYRRSGRICLKETIFNRPQRLLVQNDKVFERALTNLDTILFHSKIRALMWVSAVHEECQFLEVDWWSWPVKCRPSSNMKNMIVSHWESPPTEWMKFNVAGVVLEEVAGCGGVLRD
ncbi:hypothetical protein Godav_025854, partial [Gossypium davidsonii]|nr:hypothetical protein [Gossypium davidsonii]